MPKASNFFKHIKSFIKLELIFVLKIVVSLSFICLSLRSQVNALPIDIVYTVNVFTFYFLYFVKSDSLVFLVFRWGVVHSFTFALDVE